MPEEDLAIGEIYFDYDDAPSSDCNPFLMNQNFEKQWKGNKEIKLAFDKKKGGSRVLLPQYSGPLVPKCSPPRSGIGYPHPLASMIC
jgi:hypothetical protein